MSTEKRNMCAVKGCGTRTEAQEQLCPRCFVMLSRGVLMPSGAWFAVELDFLNQQNHTAMEQIRLLHDRVNELMGDE